MKCLCCKKNEANITITGQWTIHVCGLSTCRHIMSGGHEQTLGEWFLDESDEGCYMMIRGLEEFTIEVNHKKYIIPNDKRKVKGLHNKIQNIVLGRG